MARKRRRPDDQRTITAPVRHDSLESASAAGGQSGDLQGLSDVEQSDSESVRELVEEGQYFEAAVVNGIENAPDPDDGPLKTREVPEDDVPPEYADEVPGEPQE